MQKCPSITYGLLDSKCTSIGLSDGARGKFVELVFKFMCIILGMCINLFLILDKLVVLSQYQLTGSKSVHLFIYGNPTLAHYKKKDNKNIDKRRKLPV